MNNNYDLNLNTTSIETNIGETLIEIELPGGARGVQGETGPQGPQGPQGIQGIKGDSGVWTGDETPPSDYDVWVIPDGTPGTIPTKTSQLTNDSGFISTETDPVFSSSAASGITSTDITNWNGKSTFSGNYNDLSNKPSIPSKTSDLNNDSGFITNSVDNLTNYTTTTSLNTLLDGKQNTVLSGTSAPTSGQGEDGDIYLQYEA